MIGRIVLQVFFWIGITLVAQLFALLPVHAAFDRQWFYLSIGLAVFGCFVLLLQRLGMQYEEDGFYYSDGDGMGGQAFKLLEHVAHHDD